MSNVTVKVLGCGDAFGSGGNFNTCFFVKATAFNFLIDCGATSLIAMKRNSVSTNDVDLIAITHFHGDHYAGLPFFILDAAHVSKRKKPLTIVSPPGMEAKLKSLMELLYPGSSGVMNMFKISYVEYEKYKPVKLDNCIITAYPVLHNKKTLPHALKIKVKEKIISFSGDTEWTDELLDVSKDADLFICECNFYDRKIKGHLDYQTILNKKEYLKCKKILLTHFGESMLHNMQKVSIDCAKEGLVISV